jgi:pre-mRNA-splicing factor CWC22
MKVEDSFTKRKRSRSNSQKENSSSRKNYDKKDNKLKHNEINIKETSKNEEKIIQEKLLIQNSRAGGVYIPPFKLAKMYEELRQKSDKSSAEYQKMMWEMLRKSINGIINKVNISNIQNVIYELFNENLLRGKGLLARAIIKAQMASPNFTHVYAALVAVLNTKVYIKIFKILVARLRKINNRSLYNTIPKSF